MSKRSSSRLGAYAARKSALAVSILAVGAACSEVTPPDPGPVALRWGYNPWPTDYFLGPAGTAVPDSLNVEASDSVFASVEGVEIHWRVTSGGGTVEPATSVTDADGRARAAWTLGDQLGDQWVEATSPSSTDTVRFHAIANPPPPDDWAEVLGVGLTTDPTRLDAGTSSLTVTLTFANQWTGTLRVRTFDSCIAIIRIHDADGAEVFAFPWGCYASTWYFTIPPGETLEWEWTSDELALDPGEYTVRADLHVDGMNGDPLQPANPATTLVVQ